MLNINMPKLKLDKVFRDTIEKDPFMSLRSINELKRSNWDKKNYRRIILDNTYRNPHSRWYHDDALKLIASI